MIAMQSTRPKFALLFCLIATTMLLFYFRTALPSQRSDYISYDSGLDYIDKPSTKPLPVPPPLEFEHEFPPPPPPTYEEPHELLSQNLITETKYSVKPIAYIFPQYYPFPENDRLWGAGYTEWDNVRRVNRSGHHLEVVKPHPSIGYYDGLSLPTRTRYARFLKESGFYGAAFHHYWFAGKPVMDHVLQAMLIDGEPNIPFMLNWANEPWTARWDGLDSSEILIAQDYGDIKSWRKHFDWLLPFFRHKNYIRSEGKIQMMIYKPSHVGVVGKQMFAAWRQWAIEEGLGGMDIIETRWGVDPLPFNPDSVNEFQPHVASILHEHHPLSQRVSRVYHRGTLVCWDNTPRHPTDGGAVVHPTCTPKTWMWQMVEMLRRVKNDPNPIGAENFLFVNALNEWGEGNVLEPSVQFGDGYKLAMLKALEISEQEHVWPDEKIRLGMALKTQLESQTGVRPDVCVLIRTSERHGDDAIFKLENALRSLQKQKNPNWRAIVYETDKPAFSNIEDTIIKLLDTERIELAKLEEKWWSNETEWKAADYVVNNLKLFSETGCGEARYVLLTDGATTYAPEAFDKLPEMESDFVALNAESRYSVWDNENWEDIEWQEFCDRLFEPKKNLHRPSGQNPSLFDLHATLLSLPKLLALTTTSDTLPLSFVNYHAEPPSRTLSPLATYLLNDHHWTWKEVGGKEAHVFSNPSFTACTQTGNFWFDSMSFDESGCYSTSSFTTRFGGNFEEYELEEFRRRGFCLRRRKSDEPWKEDWE